MIEKSAPAWYPPSSYFYCVEVNKKLVGKVFLEKRKMGGKCFKKKKRRGFKAKTVIIFSQHSTIHQRELIKQTKWKTMIINRSHLPFLWKILNYSVKIYRFIIFSELVN